MGLVTTLVVLCGFFLLIVLGLVCLVAGLYYLAGFVEQHPVPSAKAARISTVAVLALHVLLLLFEDFSALLLLVGVAAHVVYLVLLRSFPNVRLTDPVFVGSCCLAVGYHLGWFYYFTNNYHPFNQVVAVFVVLVWLLPFVFFISLSTAEAPVLPAFMQLPVHEQLLRLPDDPSAPSERKRKTVNRLLWFIDALRSLARRYFPQLASSSSSSSKLT